jgi:hypothetical protein
MASVIYPKCKEAMWQGLIDASGGNVKCILVDTADYTYSASHEFLSDVPAGAREETSGNLASKTFTNGTFDCADFSFSAAAGDPCEALIYYIDTGNAATSRLLVYVDSGTGLPVTLNGGTVNVTVNASGVASL